MCLEYGSGISSAVILDALSTPNSKSKLISIESNKKWANNTKKMLTNSGVNGNFDLKVLREYSKCFDQRLCCFQFSNN